MKKYIIGNWKSNKTIEEAKDWMLRVAESGELSEDNPEKEAIVCPPYTMLPEMRKITDEQELTLKLGAQNCSPYDAGAYTGEVTASQIKEVADYVIIGHSERREHFGETDDMLATKVTLAKTAGLLVVFCVQGKETAFPQAVDIVAYEPAFAIGSGTPDTPENAEEVSKAIKEKGATVVLYGGSVTPDNIVSFTSQPSIDGALIGGASLEADSFLTLVKNA